MYTLKIYWHTLLNATIVLYVYLALTVCTVECANKPYSIVERLLEKVCVRAREERERVCFEYLTFWCLGPAHRVESFLFGKMSEYEHFLRF